MTAFVVRRFVDRGLLVDLSANPDGDAAPPRPGRPGLPPRGPGGPGRRRHPARTRAGCHPAPSAPCRLRPHGPARMGPLPAVDRGQLRHQPGRAVDVTLCTTASVDAVVAHPDGLSTGPNVVGGSSVTVDHPPAIPTETGASAPTNPARASPLQPVPWPVVMVVRGPWRTADVSRRTPATGCGRPTRPPTRSSCPRQGTASSVTLPDCTRPGDSTVPVSSAGGGAGRPVGRAR